MDLSQFKSLFVRFWRPLLAVLVGALIVWGFLEGRGERAMEAERERPVNVPQRVSVVNGETVIALDAATQQRAGIGLASLHNSLQHQQLRAYGVVVDPQMLSDLRNSYVSAQAQVQTAQAKLTQSKIAFERAQRLIAAGAISAADRDAAEATFRADQASVSSTQSQLATVAASARQSWGQILGEMIVEGAPTHMALVNRQALLIQATLPPGEKLSPPPSQGLARQDKGSAISLQFLSDASKTDTRIQGMSFFYTGPNNAGLLPGMNVLVLLPSQTMTSGAVVPGSSIVWWQGRKWIYLRTAATRFVRHEVTADVATPDCEIARNRDPSRGSSISLNTRVNRLPGCGHGWTRKTAPLFPNFRYEINAL